MSAGVFQSQFSSFPKFARLAGSEPAAPLPQSPSPAKNSTGIHIPAYCYHKAKRQAYVRLSGDFIYLGEYGSPESHAA